MGCINAVGYHPTDTYGNKQVACRGRLPGVGAGSPVAVGLRPPPAGKNMAGIGAMRTFELTEIESVTIFNSRAEFPAASCPIRDQDLVPQAGLFLRGFELRYHVDARGTSSYIHPTPPLLDTGLGVRFH